MRKRHYAGVWAMRPFGLWHSLICLTWYGLNEERTWQEGIITELCSAFGFGVFFFSVMILF